MCSCEYGQLKPIDPVLDDPFTVTAINPTTPFDGKTFEACDGRFLLGPDEPCTVCPPSVPDGDCPPGEETIFLDDDDLVNCQPITKQRHGRTDILAVCCYPERAEVSFENLDKLNRDDEC